MGPRRFAATKAMMRTGAEYESLPHTRPRWPKLMLLLNLHGTAKREVIRHTRKHQRSCGNGP